MTMSDTAITILWYTVPLVSTFIMLVALWDAGVFDKLLDRFYADEESAQAYEIGQLRWTLRSMTPQGRRS